MCPGSWRLVDKIGLSLADIHLMGNVHKYKENLQFSMDRYPWVKCRQERNKLISSFPDFSER